MTDRAHAPSRYEHLLDCISLATGILIDSVICMTKDGVQVDQTVLDQLQTSAEDVRGECFFIFDRELLYADMETFASMLELDMDVTPIDPGTLNCTYHSSPYTYGTKCSHFGYLSWMGKGC